jgi:hypothetical protein
MNPLTDTALPYNDELIAKYAGQFNDIPENRTILGIYARMNVKICRGIFVGYMHAYSALSVIEDAGSESSKNSSATLPETEAMTQLKFMIHAVCKRICDSKN